MMVQPSFAYFGGKSAYGECGKQVVKKPDCSKKKTATAACSGKKAARPSCSKGKCNKPSDPSGKDECSSQGCNPSIGCSSGNFYVFHHFQITLHSWVMQTQKALVTDDNRVVKSMSDCWHPPELNS